MNHLVRRIALFALFILLLLPPTNGGANAAGREADPEALRALAAENAEAEATARTPQYFRLAAETTGPMGAINEDPNMDFLGMDEMGYPIILGSENVYSAISIGTQRLWPGGNLGLALVGANEPGQLAVWETGTVRTTHREFVGRVTIMDEVTTLTSHAAHVTGTMVASGYDNRAHGMSPGGYVHSYNTRYVLAEMPVAAANGLRLSNHSYGFITGWRYNNGEWYWYGRPNISEIEDYRFGRYGNNTTRLDEIAFSAPHYLIVKSNGNDRNDAGPGPGGFHWVYDPGTEQWIWVDTTRDPDGGATGFDTMPLDKCGKNILSVGAVEDIHGGWSGPESVVMSAFSSWGPTDDGRIKPDIVANGTALFSASSQGDDLYAIFSGTSMAAPSVTGSLNLLVTYFQDNHGYNPRSATMKAMIANTAQEAGTAPGPDYSYGWGLFNSVGIQQLIADDAANRNRILESTLVQGTAEGHLFYSDGIDPITLTLCWTDPPGTQAAVVVDPPDLMLVNDLDVRLVHMESGTGYAPWILDPAAPAAPATTGDNFRDNLEQIHVEVPAAGYYQLTIFHKGILQGAAQDFSLVQSGLRQVFHVATDGSDAAMGTDTAPLATIQAAVDKLIGGGEVILEPGTYDQTAVTVTGMPDIRGGTGDPRDVVLTGAGFTFDGAGGRLADVTLRGMAETPIQCIHGATTLIEDCVLDENAGLWSGGILSNESAPVIRSCTFAKNGGPASVTAAAGGSVRLEETLIAHGAGMAVWVYGDGSAASLSCCNLYQNGGGDWIEPFAHQVDLDGNFSADPCFCDLAGGVYTLTEDSHCLPGHHPWGCDGLVGALGVGCDTGECGGVVATFVSDFCVEREERAVRVSWTAPQFRDPGEFRVARGTDPSDPAIPVSLLGGGRFEALDTDVVADGMPATEYTLFHAGAEGWTAAARGRMDLPGYSTVLKAAVPNPFNPRTEISFTLSDRQDVRLEIYDLAGRRVLTLVDGTMPAGEHAVPWLGRDTGGRAVPSGAYVARLVTADRVDTIKLLLAR